MTMAPDSALVADVRPSPNHGERLAGIDMLVLHYTGMRDAASALDRLSDPAAQVSAHYLVHEGGAIVQLVPEARRAWHAGASSWQGVTDINSCSVGIEIVNPGHDFGYPDFPAPQIEAVISLCADIAARHDIAPRRVLAHSDIAPARKQDPGEKFPWAVLFEAGIGHWVTPTPPDGRPGLAPGDTGPAVDRLRSELAHYGYGLERSGPYDHALAEVVTAFQRHFRPARVDGVADHSTLDTLHRLLARLDRSGPAPAG